MIDLLKRTRYMEKFRYGLNYRKEELGTPK